LKVRLVLLAAYTTLGLAPAPVATGAGAAGPGVQLSVSPAKLALDGPGSRTIRVRNAGTGRVVVHVTRRWADRIWLRLVPSRLTLRPGVSGVVTVRAAPRGRAEPGERRATILVTTQPLARGRVDVRVRLGVRLTMHTEGQVVRRLVLGSAHRRAHTIVISLVNNGNVTVRLRGRIAAVLLRRGRRVARLQPQSRAMLSPGARTTVSLRYETRVRGAVSALVRVALGTGARSVERRYRLRL